MSKISIIVPVYKVEQYLKRCIESLLGQTFEDFELILVDDGSPDKCGGICEEYAQRDNRIIVIHKENGGLSDARNKGIDWVLSNSDSDWITFVDSDDYVHKNYLELLFNAACDKKVNISCCGHIKVDDEPIIQEKLSGVEIDVNDAESLLGEYNYTVFNIGVAWGRLFKKEIWAKLRFPFGKYHEDAFTIYKALYENGDIAVVKAVMYYYYINERGIMNSPLSPKRMEDSFESKNNQIRYFYEKGFYNSLIYVFKKYATSFEKYEKEYKNDKEFSDVLKKHKRNIRQIFRYCRRKVPQLHKYYGFISYLIKIRNMVLSELRSR